MSDTTADHSEHDAHDHGDHHVVSFWALAAVFVALLILTVVTVLVSEAELGHIALLVAMIVAVVKGSLVCLFFMHLWWDSLFNSIALVAALVFVALFLSLSILDSSEYQPDQIRYDRVFQPVTPEAPPETPAHGEPGHNHATDH